MTPKEKAKDLFVKNFEIIPNYIKQIDAKHIAKQCALIAVDEILAIFYNDYQSMWLRELNFWHLVKEEIEKL